MRQVVLHNLTNRTVTPLSLDYCDSFLCQLRGLTFRRFLPENWGLLLVGKRNSRLDASIHMLFMFTDLTVVWINAAFEVVDVRLARRWQPALFPRSPAQYVLETHPERLDDFHVGDRVELIARQ